MFNCSQKVISLILLTHGNNTTFCTLSAASLGINSNPFGKLVKLALSRVSRLALCEFLLVKLGLFSFIASSILTRGVELSAPYCLDSIYSLWDRNLNLSWMNPVFKKHEISRVDVLLDLS